MHLLRRERLDLVLLDLMLPERDGWDVTRVVRGDVNLAAMPIIMLTARVEDHDKVELRGNSEAVAQQLHSVGLELGADDYVAKSFNPREVVARVRAVLRRVQGEPAPSRVIRVRELTVDLDARRVKVQGQSVHLTPTEFALLRALAEQPGRTLTRQEMIEKGLGHSYDGLERTVDSHIKNLRHRLDEAGAAAHLVETVFGVGYRLAAGDHALIAFGCNWP
jgi:two-component system alkaline phosphatase synthesis response regulator PhoP